MQFTRSMQSLGDDYGFIFDTQAADIDIYTNMNIHVEELAGV